MKSYRQELVFNIPGRCAFVNITQQVRQALQNSGIQEGLLLCNAIAVPCGQKLRWAKFRIVHGIWNWYNICRNWDCKNDQQHN